MSGGGRELRRGGGSPDGGLHWEALRRGARILDGIRRFFRGRRFFSRWTPRGARIPEHRPQRLPHRVEDPSGNASASSSTPPRAGHEKLLAADPGHLLSRKVYATGRIPLHAPEFTMLEWSRVGVRDGEVMPDVEEFARHLIREATAARRFPGGRDIPLSTPWPGGSSTTPFRSSSGGDDGRGRPAEALSGKGRAPPGRIVEDIFLPRPARRIEPAAAGGGEVLPHRVPCRPRGHGAPPHRPAGCGERSRDSWGRRTRQRVRGADRRRRAGGTPGSACGAAPPQDRPGAPGRSGVPRGAPPGASSLRGRRARGGTASSCSSGERRHRGRDVR